METIILDIQTLPLQIREKLSSSKVFVKELDGNIILIPLNDNKKLNLGVKLVRKENSHEKENDKLK